jgi:hypothetical protein
MLPKFSFDIKPFSFIFYKICRHNLFLHSALVLSRKIPRSVHGIKVTSNSSYIDLILYIFYMTCMVSYPMCVARSYSILLSKLRISNAKSKHVKN